MKRIIVATILIFFLLGCSSTKVYVDTQKEYDFSSLSQFTITYVKKEDINDFFRNRVAILLEDYFTSKGYLSSDKLSADFYIHFTYSIETKTTVTQETRAQRPIIYLRGMRNTPLNLTATCNSTDLDKLLLTQLVLAEYSKPIDTIVSMSTHEYKYAKLFIELIDAKSKDVIWQGLAEDDLSYVSNHKEIEEIIKRLFNDFPKK